MSICTKTGDDGKTSLYTGERVAKNSPRVQVYGAIDEAGSALAMSRAFSEVPEVKTRILEIQKLLGKIMADFASLNKPAIVTDGDIAKIDEDISKIESIMPPVKSFIIPGESKAGAMLDLARTTIRRAERLACELAETEKVHDSDKIILNRLSDYCFLLMRAEDDAAKSGGARYSF